MEYALSDVSSLRLWAASCHGDGDEDSIPEFNHEFIGSNRTSLESNSLS